MKSIVHYKESEARDFFSRLAAYAAEYVARAIHGIHRHWPSSNHYEHWNGGGPIGNILHYTAGVSFAGTVRHFVLGRSASANFVVAKALDARFDALRRDLDLERDLRAEVVQIVHPEKPSWHAGWVNRFLTGIEVRNAGILRPVPKGVTPHAVSHVPHSEFFSRGSVDVDDLDFYWWVDGWTAKFTGEVLRVETRYGVSWWESWSRGSVATVITLLRYLNSLYPGRLESTWLLAHHQVNPRKNDVVLPLPLGKIREAVLFSREHVDDLEWLAEFDDCEDGFEDIDDPWLLSELDRRQLDRAEEDADGFDPADCGGASEVHALDSEAARALYKLGYAVATPEEVRASLRVYQRGRDLSATGDFDSLTRKRLFSDVDAWKL